MKILNKADAILYRKQLEKAINNLDDKSASKSVVLYPKMEYGESLIEAGTRINFDGELYKATIDLWDTYANNPENAPTLWEEIAYHNGIRIIPETITVTTAFALGELGYFKADGKVYKSLMDANVYTPKDYPQGWEVQ